MTPPHEQRPDQGGAKPSESGDETQKIGGIIPNLKGAWEFIQHLLPKNDPLRRASAWFLVALVLVAVLLVFRARAGTAEAASAFIFVFMGLLVVVAFVNVLYVVIPGDRGTAARVYAFGRAVIAVSILAGMVVVSTPFRATISRDGPAIILSWLHGLGWVSISEAVGALPPKYDPAVVRDGQTLVASYMLEPLEDPRDGNADVNTRRLLETLSNRKELEIVGTVTVVDMAASHDTFLLAARKVRFANGASIEIGRSSLLIIAEVLEIGDSAEHRASVVAYARANESSAKGTAGRKGLDAGNLTIILSGRVTNGILAADLRGEDGENGSDGKPGESGEAFKPKSTPASAKGFLIRFQTAQDRARAREAIHNIRSNSGENSRCSMGTECMKTLHRIETYLALCDKDANVCPDWDSSVCFLRAESGPDVPNEERYRGKQGGSAGNGGDGGAGGTLRVMVEGGADDPHIVLNPAVGRESADRRTKQGASSGGTAGTAGPGGVGARAIEGGANDPDKICGAGQPGTEAAPGPSGPMGSPGRAGRAHERLIRAISTQAH
jgi:hypothetical protein